jgi:hypothetical protein
MKTIVWDIDDVLNDCMRMWLEKDWLPLHRGCILKYEDLTENPPNRLLGAAMTEYLESLDKFRLSSYANEMIPDAEVLKWFKFYGTSFRHIALTARPRQSVSPAIIWMLRHFSEWFQTLSFVPSERPGESPGCPDRTKGEFLAWLGKADFFIDDSPQNIHEAESLGIQTFLVARPWNNSRLTLVDILNILGEEF